ncbi:MAG: M23 family metallopeptidase [Bacteroidia bacterium]
MHWKHPLARCLFIGLCGIHGLLFAQEYPRDYFRSPLDIPLKLSGTFGELRTNHFHSGLDIRTNSMEGLKVYATADGYISRIKVSAYGYGNALYIDHPNGFTTVYAHLRDFEDPIRSLAEKNHYDKQSFELDLVLYPDEIPVKKGQVIAYSGNTGGSGGPHLHFEVRDTKTEAVINPKHFGFSITDRTAPVFDFMEVVPYGPNARVNGSSNKRRFTALKSGQQFATGQRIEIAGSNYLQFRVWDKHDGNEFRNGIYRLLLLEDQDTLYHFTADRFEFNETRYANAVMDYQARMLNREQIYRCFQPSGNLLQLLRSKAPYHGLISIEAGSEKKLTAIASDFDGNSSSMQIHLIGVSPTAEISGPDKEVVRYSPLAAWSFTNEDVQLQMPANNLYDTINFIYQRTVKPYAMFSAVHSLHHARTPVHAAFDLALRHSGLADSLRSKTLMVNININQGRTATTGKWDGDWFRARVRGLGDYYLAVDTTPPVIKVINLRAGGTYQRGQQMRFTMSDNLAGIQSYALYLNDQWQKLVFDGKTASLTYTVHQNSPKGNLNLRLVVKDAVGNETTYSTKITII